LGVFGDTLNEFKQAKPQEKIIIIGASVAVVGIAWYIHSKNSQQTGPAQAATGAGTSSAGNQGLQYSAGNYPYLPGGTQAITDSNGNLVGFQPGTGTGTGTTGSPGPAGPPGAQGPAGSPGPIVAPGPFSGPQAGVPLWQQLHGNLPIIPSGQYSGPSYSNLKPGTKYNYQGTTYTLTTQVKGMPGSGVLYGISPTGKTVTLYGPPSAYAPKQGGGAYGTAVLGQRGKRAAPTKEGHPYVARTYARRAS
jgi:hypothetical protein